MKIAKRATLEDLQPKDIKRLADDIGVTAPYIRKQIKVLGDAVLQNAPIVHEGFSLSKSSEEFMARYEGLVIDRAGTLMGIASFDE